MKILRRILEILVVVGLTACASDTAPIEPTPPVVNGSVKGTITDDAGDAVPNATVMLTGNGQAARTTSTDPDGVYTFADVPAGNYTVAVSPPSGYSQGAASTASVAVTSGAQASPTGLVLLRAAVVPPFLAALKTRLEAATAANEFSGTVLIMRNDSTIFEGAYGLADREQGIPNTLETQFRLGSMNKMITAVAVMQLVQAGKVNLNATLATYLPDYPNTDLASKVTLHHLLTHTGGTGDIFGPQFTANRLDLRTVDDYLKLYGSRGLQFTPGAQWAYSNYGFILLGAVIERVSGMSYDDYVAANILTPAGMTATDAAALDSLGPLRAIGYTKQIVPGQLVSNASTLPYRGTPAGGGYSTVADLARFSAALKENRLLNPALTTQLLAGKVTITPLMKYAYGFVDQTMAGRRFVGHDGGSAGMNGDLMFQPNGGYVVVVLSNLDPPSAQMQSGFILASLPPQ